MSNPTQNGALPRDDNDTPVAGAVEDNAAAAIVPWKVDPTSGRLLVSATISGYGTPVYNEQVSGSGTSWTLAHTPANSSLQLYASGQRLAPTTDYTLSGATITTTISWSSGILYADYNY